MSIPLFKDFGKTAKDLVNKNYPNTKKVTLKTASENGVQLDTEITKDGNNVTGAFTPKVSLPKYGLTIEQTVNHTDLVHGEITIKDKLGKGTKVTIGHVCGGKAPQVSGAVEYQHARGNVTANVVYPVKGQNATVSVSAAVGKPCCAAGVSVKASLAESALTHVDAGVHYTKGRYALAAVSKVKQPESANAAGIATSLMAHCDVDSKLAVATAVNFSSVPKTGSALEQVDVTVAGSYKPDAETTLRARFGTSGLLGLSWSNQINSRTKLTLATVVNTTSDTKGKLGFELALDA